MRLEEELGPDRLRELVEREFPSQTARLAEGLPRRDFLRLMGTVMLGFMWLKMATTAHIQLAGGGPDSDFYNMKLATARYYMARVMPDTAALLVKVKAGADTVMDPDADWF